MFLYFPPGTEMVHFPGFARTRLWIHRAVRRFYLRGFPHSEISGSMPACGSPKLIAACHVFHRLLLPRHPPCALSSLTTKFTRHTGRLYSRSFRQFHCHPERIKLSQAKVFRVEGSLPAITDGLKFSCSANSSNTPRKSHGPKNSAHRVLNAY
jgi:hypothetical protein